MTFCSIRPRRQLAIGYNVGERRLRRELLRPARLGGAARQLRRDRAGQTAAGELVRARPPADDAGGAAGSAVVERLDVRVPDAAAGDADATTTRCSTRPARRRSSGRSPTAASAACPGAFRSPATTRSTSRLNYQYRAFGVPGPGLEARTGRGPGDRAVRVGAGADGRARGGVRESAAARRRGLRRQIRLLRGDRLHAVAPAARRVERGGALVHGAPPGHEPAVARLSAARPPDAEALRVRPAVPGDACCCCRSGFRRPSAFHAHAAELSDIRAAGRAPEMPMRILATPDTPIPEVQLLSNGRYHVMVTNAGGG